MVGLERITDSLLCAGLLQQTQINEACDELRRTGSEVNGEGLLAQLQAQGLLTSYQSRRVEEGRTGDLIFGNYVILNRIGVGGMGEVFKALHRRMRRVVALKVIRKDSQSPDFKNSFQREIQAAARLNHVNIVAAYDADECELGDFLVMEYVEGSDLDVVLRQSGPLHAADALDVIRQAATGLAYAHSQGVVHRDIKPANLMRDISGVVKVADLGLAQLRVSGDSGLQATKSGFVAGTVDFMSPEQATDMSAVDQRSDVYSLGCTLFTLLTSRPVFPARSVMEGLLAHRNNAPPSLGELIDDASAGLDLLFQRMVSKRRSERFQSMDDVVRAIDGLRQSPTPKTIAQANGGLEKSTVLLVENSNLQVRIIRKLLESIQFDDVQVCSTGSEALERLATLPADVVLTSFELRDMNGLALAERIRTDLRWSRTGVLIMSSNDPSSSVREALGQLGAVGTIQKPFDATKLEAAIHEMLRDDERQRMELANLKDLRVLIVDDSSLARRRVQETLTELGFAVFDQVSDGDEAIPLLSQSKFDLVVTDYNMPRVNGRELVNFIRNRSNQNGLPIVMVTSEFDPVRLAEIYQLGVSAICNKSFDRDLVRNIVIRLFM